VEQRKEKIEKGRDERSRRKTKLLVGAKGFKSRYRILVAARYEERVWGGRKMSKLKNEKCTKREQTCEGKLP
jgi:hypothetical protein